MIRFKKDFGGGMGLQKRQAVVDSDEIGIGFGSGPGDKRWAEKLLPQSLTFEQMDQMYQINPVVRACVDKTVTRTVNISPLIKMVRNEENAKKVSDETKRNLERVESVLDEPDPQNDQTLLRLQKQVFTDLLKYDAAGLEITKDRNVSASGGDSGVRPRFSAVGGDTIKLNVDNKGNFRQEAYLQVTRNREKVAEWPRESMMYFMMNPQANRVYGLSPLESLVNTVMSDLYAENYNSDFFFNNATPRLAVIVENLGIGQGSDQAKRFSKWWDSQLKGKPHRPIILTTEEQGKITLEKMAMSNEEMQFQQYARWLTAKIMMVYKMQPLILGLIDENMGKLNSAEQVRQFNTEAVMPMLSELWAMFNMKAVWAKTCMNIKDVYVSYDLDLFDKKTQAEWHEIYLRSGVLTINEIRVHGLGMQPVDYGDVPYLQNNVTPFGASGSALPQTAEDTAVNGGAVTGGQTPTLSRSLNPGNYSTEQLQKIVNQDSQLPVGWENMPPTDRYRIVEDLIKMREKALARRFIIPKSVMLDKENVE